MIRDGFRALAGPAQTGSLDTIAIPDQQPAEVSLRELVESEVLKPGDLLDPLDPDWAIDAVVSGDGTILIDGTHEFDTLDDAARFVGVTNVSGFEFWALEVDGGFASLPELVSS